MAAVTMAQMFAFGGTPRVANGATPPRGELSSHYEVAAESRRMIAKGNTGHKTVLFSMAPEAALATKSPIRSSTRGPPVGLCDQVMPESDRTCRQQASNKIIAIVLSTTGGVLAAC